MNLENIKRFISKNPSITVGYLFGLVTLILGMIQLDWGVFINFIVSTIVAAIIGLITYAVTELAVEQSE